MQKASLDSNCILLHFHARFLHAKKLLAHAFAKTWRLSDGVTLQSTLRRSHVAVDADCKTTATWPPCIFWLTSSPQIQYKVFIIKPIIYLELDFRRSRTRALQFCCSEIILRYLLHTNLWVLKLLLLLYKYISDVIGCLQLLSLLLSSCLDLRWGM
jgi:hypothetical protein